MKLNLDLEPDEILRILEKLVAGDLIEPCFSDIHFAGLQDGTLNLILRSRFEMEIKHHGLILIKP